MKYDYYLALTRAGLLTSEEVAALVDEIQQRLASHFAHAALRATSGSLRRELAEAMYHSKLSGYALLEQLGEDGPAAQQRGKASVPSCRCRRSSAVCGRGAAWRHGD